MKNQMTVKNYIMPEVYNFDNGDYEFKLIDKNC